MTPPEQPRALTVRFDATAYELVRAEAAHAGVPVAQFIREAVLIRTVLRARARHAPGMALDFAELALQVEILARVRRR